MSSRFIPSSRWTVIGFLCWAIIWTGYQFFIKPIFRAMDVMARSFHESNWVTHKENLSWLQLKMSGNFVYTKVKCIKWRRYDDSVSIIRFKSFMIWIQTFSWFKKFSSSTYFALKNFEIAILDIFFIMLHFPLLRNISQFFFVQGK